MSGMAEGIGAFTVGEARVRVVTDCAADISAIVQAEERVVRRLVDQGLWRHETVTLFVLDDLAPLVGQLARTHRLVADDLVRLPQRPMVNLYDPRHATECFVFVNRHIMTAEGYWGDSLAAEGLLAHEHAHPLSEAPATTAARTLTVEAEGPATLAPLAAQLGRTLSTGAVTELLANRFCLVHGFDDALRHLDRLTLRQAVNNLPQRLELERRAAAAVAAGTLPSEQLRPLLRLADAQISLPFALELVPFVQSGLTAEMADLEELLLDDLMSRMAPEVTDMYRDLSERFLRLQPEWSGEAIAGWCADILLRLSAFLSAGGAPLSLRLAPIAPKAEGPS
ncbi:hypothetical protein KHC23_11555 [Ancylobacter dichloromethanicus]|uniref:Uncharacterized protein n=1 Tax=Ancylobacter dichloromethanicus TaxID=518825 RepID=A0A9W6MYU9_9HYPH|nr:hypothetical protein [Ancylobacter dichloromethanicus]MBS7554286.1 hypothetical protein [Ancylobacter dichloromethanicus]GLK71411.1 hypothetical protein GCM10017643_15260 [Ancylobacter dichloromethanicus]